MIASALPLPSRSPVAITVASAVCSWDQAALLAQTHTPKPGKSSSTSAFPLPSRSPVTIAAAFAVFFVTRTPAEHAPVVGTTTGKPAPTLEQPEPATDEDLAALLQMADVHRASHLSARWGHIKKPLRPYKQLIEGVTP